MLAFLIGCLQRIQNVVSAFGCPIEIYVNIFPWDSQRQAFILWDMPKLPPCCNLKSWCIHWVYHGKGSTTFQDTFQHYTISRIHGSSWRGRGVLTWRFLPRSLWMAEPSRPETPLSATLSQLHRHPGFITVACLHGASGYLVFGSPQLIVRILDDSNNVKSCIKVQISVPYTRVKINL